MAHLESAKKAVLHPEQMGLWLWPNYKQQIKVELDFHWLSSNEKIRWERILNLDTKRQFLAGRFLLKNILSQKFQKKTSQVELILPRFENVFFSLSHSKNVVGVGLSSLGEIGLDLENRPPLPRNLVLAEKIVERFFSQEERDQFQSLPQARRLSYFFRNWTLKEAYYKYSFKKSPHFMALLKTNPEHLLSSACSNYHLNPLGDRTQFLHLCVVYQKSLGPLKIPIHCFNRPESEGVQNGNFRGNSS